MKHSIEKIMSALLEHREELIEERGGGIKKGDVLNKILENPDLASLLNSLESKLKFRPQPLPGDKRIDSFRGFFDCHHKSYYIESRGLIKTVLI